ncbi:ABC transporter ATP-binding protein [Aureimonas leprariae]|uniref:ABC transporter ATP-binding protein n=1 Tax=Plantimonas leprariae TaxID=2615207 RepID=A0A7V7PK26_9HYPH|nr:ABC transporter ATP-binding protein [Aureimonas leprariae]KAB0675919.1 ABC transporter ATP-binding protein [Aureimonas leprariae]
MTTAAAHAISFQNVTKRYRLGGGSKEQLADVLGLSRFFGRRQKKQEFLALDDVSFQLERGRRMGLIGRNGAGKTTLLKLISGNYRPTSGSIDVNGSIQALMTMGQGFHPDYTGRENIDASLHYNGLSRRQAADAFEDVVEFCELGPFLDQPFRTYSSGMQSRLMFATATAIRPDILIIDEVMGAGDAYFLAKSKQRVDRIISDGCTLLLVSHAMQQVLELCDEVIWLEGGRVNMIDEAFRVVKAYEEALYGALPGSGDPSSTRRRLDRKGRLVASEKALTVDAAHAVAAAADGAGSQHSADDGETVAWPGIGRPVDASAMRMQIPRFVPHAEAASMLPPVPNGDGRTFRNLARDGISRWGESGDLQIVGFAVSNANGLVDRLVSLQPAKLTIFLEAHVARRFDCTYGVAIHDLQGRPMARFFSEPDHFDAVEGTGRRIDLILNPNQLGPGVYSIGISIHEETSIEDASSAIRYDLLSRSFEVTVELPDSLSSASAQFFHSAEWDFHSADLPEAVAEDVRIAV